MNKRIKTLQNLMGDLDCILVTSPEDILYYSDYQALPGDSSILAVMEQGARLFTTPNGHQNKKASVDITLLNKTSDFFGFIKNYKVVGFDENHLLSRSYLNLKKRGLRLKQVSNIIKDLRMIKDSDEVEKIKKAIAVTKNAFKLKPSGTEIDFASKIDCFFGENGANNAFETIVASGINSSNIHYMPSKRKIGKKDMLIVDMGAKVNGYCSDMTRTFCSSPGKQEKKIMENVKNIQAQLFDFIKPGLKMSDVQIEYEKLLKKTGNKCFHSFGHGVGLSVHEAPVKDDVLKEGMIITVEPGIYLKNFGGCRIEDMVLIKKEKIELIS